VARGLPEQTLYLHDSKNPFHPYIIPGEQGHGVPVLPQALNNYELPPVVRGHMRAGIQFITVPTADTPGTTLYLHFDNKRYLVGQIGEGTQRACVQNGVSLKKVQDVLITGKSDSQSTGGLIGMVLTLADVTAAARADEGQKGKGGVTAARKAKRASGDSTSKTASQSELEEDLFLSLYGPQNLAHSLATARRFVFRKGMPIKVHEIKSEEPERDEKNEWLPTWADENVKVWALAITPGQGEKTADEQTVSPRNPRKRSFDEANGAQDRTANGSTERDALKQKENDQITHGVVADMFGSKWRLDTLVEKPLNEIKLPAKMWIRNPETKSLDEYTGPLPGGAEALPDPTPMVFVRNPWPGALVASLPKTSPNKVSVSYILVQHPRRGKFDPKAAEKHKIPHKSLYGKLTSGENVVNADGVTITPDMVMGPDEPGNGVAVIDLPSLEYVQPLIARPEWKSPEVTGRVGAIVWILGRGVAASPLLQKFMKTMSHMEHIVSSPDCCPNSLSMDSASSSAIKLAAIDTTTFPVPYHDNKTLPQAKLGTPTDLVQALPAFAHVAQRGQRVQIEPVLLRLDDQIMPPLDTLSVIRESNSQEIMDLARLSRTALQAPDKIKETEAWISQIPLPDVEITTLGTGSALPSKYRNVSSTLVRVPGHGSYLFDAGENTLGQLRRVFKPTELEAVLKDLRMIWISHLHADHHLGIVPVIKAWHQVVHGNNSGVPPVSESALDKLQADCEQGLDVKSKYLAVLSDLSMLRYLEEYSQVEDFGYKHILPLRMVAAHFGKRFPSKFYPVHASFKGETSPLKEEMLKGLLGVRDIQAALVAHCHGAMAVSITFPFATSSTGGSEMPFKVSYSGDCRPSENFAAIGADSTVLIHEATFEDELYMEAYAKRHSTVSEALGVGSLMRAKAVVLTHFSQRYSKIPVVDGFWGDRSKIETAIKGAGEQQDRLQGVDIEEEDEIQPADEAEVETAEETGPWTIKPKLTQTDKPAEADFFTKPLGPKNPNQPDNMKVVIAFDYMKFKLRDMPRMEALRPALAKLFEENIGSETSSKVKEKIVQKKKEKAEKWEKKNEAKTSKKMEGNKPEKNIINETQEKKKFSKENMVERPQSVVEKNAEAMRAKAEAMVRENIVNSGQEINPRLEVNLELEVNPRLEEGKTGEEKKDVEMVDADLQKEWEELTSSR
jgi:ribonuclease Z